STLKSDVLAPRIRIGRMPVLRFCLLLQVVAGTLLAVTAGLGIRSINNLEAIDPGFRPDGLMVSSLDLSSLSPQRRAGFLSQLQNELPRLAGVASVSLAAEAPTG